MADPNVYDGGWIPFPTLWGFALMILALSGPIAWYHYEAINVDNTERSMMLSAGYELRFLPGRKNATWIKPEDFKRIMENTTDE